MTTALPIAMTIEARLPETCREIIEPTPLSGRMNMALDSFLLDRAVQYGETAVRIYRWSEPTLSLGYFQRESDPADQARFASVATVRRLTGGGAILHHHELTYSCVLPPGHPLGARPVDLYTAVHDIFIRELNRQGACVRLRGKPLGDRGDRFLCFARGDEHDVVLSGHKVLGSAQRRRKGAVLQHGSLILAASPLAPEFPGLLELAGLQTLFDIFAEVICCTVSRLIAQAGVRLHWTQNEIVQVETALRH
jgi:lipoate-protein ligase A